MAFTKEPDYAGLLPYCITEKETAYIKTLSEGKSQAAAAHEHDVARPTIADTIYRIRLRKKKQQSGQSTLYNEAGSPSATWVKGQSQKGQRSLQEVIDDTVSAFNEKVKVRSVSTKAPKVKTKDLLACICIGDAHLGMFSWAEKAKEDFDLKIGCKDLTDAADRIIEAIPATEEILIAQLGDFYHIDDSLNQTPANKNPLDADSRFSKIIQSGIYVLRHFIEKALTKHKIVRVRNVAGNHDPHSHVALSCALATFYHDNKRVIIEDSPRAMYYYRFGKNLIGITHGHMPKPDKLPAIMAVDCPEWAECEFKYCWHGHIHTKRSFEAMNVIVESFRTLAPGDAWTIDSGYRSGRELVSIILDKDFGEVERHTAGIKRVRNG
tara:strand:- start:998 stop:2137 length:1140 start_codon:yes stop_codon:yes gene_type:complete